MKINLKFLLIIFPILIFSICFNVKAQDSGVEKFDIGKILSEMLIVNKSSSKKDGKPELTSFSTAVFSYIF